MTEETSELDNVGAEMDAANLYSEEVVTDRKVGVIRILTPIDANGQRDPSRAPIFTGETQIMTQMGPLPISFGIPAANVAEAVAGYSAAAREGLRKTVERIRELQREAASQIVTPGMPGFQAPPAAPQGGGIVMP